MPFPIVRTTILRTCGLVYRISRDFRNLFRILACADSVTITMAAAPAMQAVSRWLQQTKGIAVQDEWLGACTEWILNEEVAGG